MDSGENIALDAYEDSILAHNRTLEGDLKSMVASVRSLVSRIHVSYHKGNGPWEDCSQLTCQETRSALSALRTSVP